MADVNIQSISQKFYNQDSIVWFDSTACNFFLTPEAIETHINNGEFSLLGTNCAFGYGFISHDFLPDADLYLAKDNQIISLYHNEAPLVVNERLAKIYSIVYDQEPIDIHQVIHFNKIIPRLPINYHSTQMDTYPKEKARVLQNKLLSFPRPFMRPGSQMVRFVNSLQEVLPDEPIENLQTLFFLLLSAMFSNQVGISINNQVLRGQLSVVFINTGQAVSQLAYQILARQNSERVITHPDLRAIEAPLAGSPFVVIRDNLDQYQLIPKRFLKLRNNMNSSAVSLLATSNNLVHQWDSSFIDQSIFILSKKRVCLSELTLARPKIQNLIKDLVARQSKFGYVLAKMTLDPKCQEIITTLEKAPEVPNDMILNIIRCAMCYSAYLHETVIDYDTLWEVIKLSEIWFQNWLKMTKISKILCS